VEQVALERPHLSRVHLLHEQGVEAVVALALELLALERAVVVMVALLRQVPAEPLILAAVVEVLD
jgi:hypothetical protein